ncbi:MAG: hypothetical protein RR090_12820 [Niameybacter sp.]
MKKILPIFAVIMAMSFFSCGNSKSKTACADSTQCDTTQQCMPVGADTLRVCGVAIDGAMNSIYLKTEKGDSIGFGYPELDPSKRVKWMIGDTVTVTYLHVNDADTVLYMTKGCCKK